jgi:hypothetical protein
MTLLTPGPNQRKSLNRGDHPASASRGLGTRAANITRQLGNPATGHSQNQAIPSCQIAPPSAGLPECHEISWRLGGLFDTFGLGLQDLRGRIPQVH